MQIEHFFDAPTSTLSYLLIDTASRQAALIDSVLDFDQKSGRTSTRSADHLIARVREQGLTLRWLLETHAHADHLSAAPYLKAQLGGEIAIGAHITQVQRAFGEIFNAEPGFSREGRQFDRLLHDGETIPLGGLSIAVMHTPGHTPACVAYVVEDGDERAAFVGDTLFMPDYGTARCDFPGGDARTLFRSIRRLLTLPDDCQLHMCHDYQPGGREMRFRCRVDEARAHNIHVHEGVREDDFVAMRDARDRTLDMPTLLLPAVQVNMRAGELPPPEDNGVRYLKIPLDRL